MDVSMADRLVELRKKHGYSQEDLADKLNISRQAVSKWERAESAPDTDNLIALSKLYGISIDSMLDIGTKEDKTNVNHTHIIAIPINRKKVLKIVGFVFLGLGILFVIIGSGFFLGFTVPETRDLKIAQNQSIQPINAEVVRIERTNIGVNGETMYKIVYEWSNELSNGSGKSNGVYSKSEAEDMIGKTVQIRVDDGRGVMVDYHRSALSTIGFVFFGVFGGLGVLFIGSFVLIFVLNKRQNQG